jgi:type II secretory pathway pseudopilin PulG
MKIAPEPPQPIEKPRPFQFRLVTFLIVVAMIAAVLAVFVPIVKDIRQYERSIDNQNRLKLIAIALQNYHDTHKKFPPAFQVDAAGNRTHSWRASILPFLEGNLNFAQYSFAEPWDGPTNSRLSWKDMKFYTSPAGNDRAGTTNYVAIVGKGTIWRGAKSTDFADIKDGTSNTIMVVEIANSDIHWMEPRDLPIEELEAWLDPSHQPRLGGEIHGGIVVMADGSVRYISRDIAIEELRAMITPSGKD